jgi:hypothetical protein
MPKIRKKIPQRKKTPSDLILKWVCGSSIAFISFVLGFRQEWRHFAIYIICIVGAHYLNKLQQTLLGVKIPRTFQNKSRRTKITKEKKTFREFIISNFLIRINKKRHLCFLILFLFLNSCKPKIIVLQFRTNFVRFSHL